MEQLEEQTDLVNSSFIDLIKLFNENLKQSEAKKILIFLNFLLDFETFIFCIKDENLKELETTLSLVKKSLKFNDEKNKNFEFEIKNRLKSIEFKFLRREKEKIIEDKTEKNENNGILNLRKYDKNSIKNLGDLRMGNN